MVLGKVTVRLTVQYENLLSQAERDPAVDIYYSQNIKSKPVNVKLPENNPGKKMTVILEGMVDDKKPLEVDSQICFYTLCTKENDFGSPCRVDAGFATVSLSEIFAVPRGVYSKDVPLRLFSCNGAEKGIIKLTATREDVKIDSRIRWETLPVGGQAVVSSANKTNKIPHPVQDEMVGMIRSVMQTEYGFRNTFQQTAKVRVPIYFGDVGTMHPEAPLPAAAFFMTSPPETNAKYWENAMEVVMARKGQTSSDFDRMPLAEQAQTVVEMCGLYVQALDYISDTFDSNRKFMYSETGEFANQPIGENPAGSYDPTKVAACERFGDALHDQCGDCEDLALAFAQCHSAFNKADFSQSSNAQSRKRLEWAQRISNQYVSFGSLDSVTAAQARAENQEVKMGAHLKCNFFPAIYMKQCIDKANMDMSKVLVARANGMIGSDMGGVFANDEVGEMSAAVIGQAVSDSKALPFKPFEPWAGDLPVLVGEGTGMFQPLGVAKDDIREERRDVYEHMSSLGAFKKPIVHPPGGRSSFFIGSMVGFTSYWFEQGHNVSGFWLGYSGKETAHIGGQFQRGVHFEKMVNKSAEISVLMHPAFSDECMAFMKRAVSVRVPTPALMLTDEGVAKHQKQHPVLAQIGQYALDMKRPVSYTQEPVNVFVRPHQLIGPVVNKFKEDIRKTTSVARVTHVLESLTDDVCMYRVGIHSNTH